MFETFVRNYVGTLLNFFRINYSMLILVLASLFSEHKIRIPDLLGDEKYKNIKPM